MSLTISEFAAQDYKGIDSVTIRPDGNIVLINGRNAQGKTSILDGIWSALKGGPAAREIKQPIREGQDAAWVRLEVSDETGRVVYIVTRKWSGDDAGSLTVKSGDKANYSSPQKLLDGLLGSISFDPLAFLGQKPAEQVQTLIDSLGDSLGFDPATLAARQAAVYNTRTEVGRVVKQLEGQLAGYPDADPTLPTAEVSASTLMAEWDAANQHNELRRRAWDTVREYSDDVSKAEVAVADAERRAAEAREKRSYLLGELQAAEKRAAGLDPEKDVTAIRARLDDVEHTNLKIRTQLHRAATEAELADRKAEVVAHTNALNAIAQEKADGIAAADLPVPGLSFNDEGVLYQGVPFAQASTAERLRVSAALAMSANPDLRVMRIDNGEALDSSGLAILESLAAAHDYQVWIARVDEHSSVGFTIEGGRVRDLAAVSA